MLMYTGICELIATNIIQVQVHVFERIGYW